MFSRLLRVISITGLLIALSGCVSQTMKEGKQDFDSENYAAALHKMQPLAEKGNADAQYAVGYMMFYGKGTPVNRQQGSAWIDKAAAQGLPEAVQAKQLLAKATQSNPLETQ